MKMILLTSTLALNLFAGSALASQHFAYHPQTGKCINAQNAEGLNGVDISKVLIFDSGKGLESGTPTISNKNLECADLRGFNFRTILNSDASYVTLKNWNLRGAVFAGSDIKWMRFDGGTVAGTKFTDAVLGYTLFSNVQRDANTVGPSDHCLDPERPNTLNCQI